MYYVSSNGTQYGPYGPEEINGMLAARLLRADDLAWTKGMAEWQPLHTIPGIRIPAVDPYAQPLAGLPPGPPAYHAPGSAGYQMPPAASGTAVASMILGILALILALSIIFGVAAGITAVVLGHVARSGIKRSQGRTGGGGMALAGLICGYIAIGMSGLLLLIAGAAVRYASIMDKGRTTKMEANISTLKPYIQIYTAKNNGQPPSMATGLRELLAKRILTDESLLTDPWGEPVQYKIPGDRSNEKYDLWSNGPDHVSGTDDDIGNWDWPE